MSELAEQTAEERLELGVASLAVSVVKLAQRLLEQERQYLALRDELGVLAGRLTLESELRATADETARNEIEDLNRRLTNVHREAIKALTRRAEGSTPA